MTYTFGLDTFGDRNSDADGKPLSHAQTIRNVAEEGVFAEQVGVDFFVSARTHASRDAPRQELGIFGTVEDKFEKLLGLVGKDLLLRVGGHQRLARSAAKSSSAW